MDLKRPKTLIVAIVLLAVLLAAEVFVVKKASDYEPKIKVIYSRVKIPAETLITKDMLIEKEVSLSLVNMKAIKDTAEAIGKVAKFDIEEMEMITNSRLTERVEEKKIQIIDEKNRLITVEFKPDQVNGWWLEDRVDIIFVPNENSASKPKPAVINNVQQKDETSEKVAYDSSGIVRLENIRVAAIIDENRQLIENIEDMTYRPILVSFEVNTEQDKFIAWAKHNGRIEVSARKIID